MNTNDIFCAAKENVAKIIGLFFQESLIERFARPDRQALQFLSAPALCAQAALCNGFGGSNQIITMVPLRFSHMIEQADKIAHWQAAQLFR